MKKLEKNYTFQDYADLAATRATFTGARIIGKRLVADKGYHLEHDERKEVVTLKRDNGPGVGTISCDCALIGGSCAIAVFEPGDINEYAACVPDTGCGSSGLFCFLEVNFAGGAQMRFKM